MRALLVQQDLQYALLGEAKLPTTLFEKEKKEVLEKEHSAIILSLGDRVLKEVSEETTAANVKRKFEILGENTGDGLLVRGKLQKKENKAQNSSSKGKANSKIKRRCYVCNKPSHLRRDCPILKNYNLKKDGDACVVSNGDSSDGYDSTSVLMITKKQQG
uniref:CCHC-type domain-containing protein n=1 Tax=Cannabis sativa TaxID=3483 RepID=A0A803Q8H7_CANSA